MLKAGIEGATAKEVWDRLRREYHDQAVEMLKGDETMLKFWMARYE